MIIGLLWGLCAFLCISKRDRNNKKMERAGIAIGIFFGIFGLCGMIGGILDNELLLATAIFLAVAILCIVAFVFALWNVSNCKTQIVATYISFNTYTGTKGYRSYSPVFRYLFRGIEYERQANETYSLKKLRKRFIQQQSYVIWINEKMPEYCITRKSISSTHVLTFAAGILMLCIYIGHVVIFLS